MTELVAPRLSAAATRLPRLAAGPKALAVLCVVALTGLGWAYLGLMIAVRAEHAGALAPGRGLLDLLTFPGLDALGRVVLDVVCRSALDAESHLPAAGAGSAADLALVALMWCAMVLAMMLPTAGPMILTYAEVAEVAAARRERAGSPLVLTAGYLAVWLAFALAATLAQWALARLAPLAPAPDPASALFSAAIFLTAGAYQFSALKHACLARCRPPFPYLFANWSTQPRAVFRLGLRQGLACLGCCWAMMLVMLAAGTMNVVWMAALGLVMAVEKITTTRRFSHLAGLALLSGGAAFVAAAVIGQWPIPPG